MEVQAIAGLNAIRRFAGVQGLSVALFLAPSWNTSGDGDWCRDGDDKKDLPKVESGVLLNTTIRSVKILSEGGASDESVDRPGGLFDRVCSLT